MRLADAQNAQQIVAAVEAEDEQLLDDIKVQVSEQVEAAFNGGEELTLRQNHDDNIDGYWQALYEVEWEDAIHEAWEKAAHNQGATGLLSSDNEAFNEWLYDNVREELGREITQPENYHENAYVDLTYQDSDNDEDVAGPGHFWVDVEQRKRKMEFVLEWPLAAVPADVLDELVEEEAWDKYSADVERVDGSSFAAKEPVDVENEYWVLDIDVDRLAEYLGDKAREWVSELVDRDPEAAAALLVEAVESKDVELANKLAKAKLPQEVLASLAVSYFSDDDIELIRETVGEFGYPGSRGQVLLTVGHADLAAMGITGGRLWDGAPWSLINLPSNELGYEGVRQRHCVGRHDMGYREQVDRGRIMVWSLRSQHNKPLLTWEINRPAMEQAETPQDRGYAVRQLKGKLNRRAGKDAAEATMLLWVFSRLGIDDRVVRDFNDAYKRTGTVFGQPYDHPQPPQGNPSFNRPCRAGSP